MEFRNCASSYIILALASLKKRLYHHPGDEVILVLCHRIILVIRELYCAIEFIPIGSQFLHFLLHRLLLDLDWGGGGLLHPLGHGHCLIPRHPLHDSI